MIAWQLLGLAQSLEACPVCFGAADQKNLASGLLWGLSLLLALTFLLIGGITLAVLRIERGRAQSDGPARP
jgi:hypothetical protein